MFNRKMEIPWPAIGNQATKVVWNSLDFCLEERPPGALHFTRVKQFLLENQGCRVQGVGQGLGISLECVPGWVLGTEGDSRAP